MYFLIALGFKYDFTGVNKNSKCFYFAIEKSSRLDTSIEMWNTIKFKLKENINNEL